MSNRDANDAKDDSDTPRGGVLEDLHTADGDYEPQKSVLPPLREWDAVYNESLHRVVFTVTTERGEWMAVAHSYEYSIIFRPHAEDAPHPFWKLSECKLSVPRGHGSATECIDADLKERGYIAE